MLDWMLTIATTPQHISLWYSLHVTIDHYTNNNVIWDCRPCSKLYPSIEMITRAMFEDIHDWSEADIWILPTIKDGPWNEDLIRGVLLIFCGIRGLIFSRLTFSTDMCKKGKLKKFIDLFLSPNGAYIPTQGY